MEAKDKTFFKRFLADAHDREPRDLSCGFQSPHDAFSFAEELERGRMVKEKIDDCQTVETVHDLLAAHLKIASRAPEHPLGRDFTNWFQTCHGTEPYIDTYSPGAGAEISPQTPPTALDPGVILPDQHDTPQTNADMNIQQDRRNPQLPPQDSIDLSRSEMPSHFQEPPEVVQTGSMMANGDNENDRGSLEDLQSPSIGQALREEEMARTQTIDGPVIDSIDGQEQVNSLSNLDGPVIDSPDFDDREAVNHQTHDGPVIDSIDGQEQVNSLADLKGPVIDREAEISSIKELAQQTNEHNL